ncbi:ERF family protein [Parasporobacterium paucivorans]|uniref:ERF superfamily protein n=1 Tax=Parasporobacterium paucivorans DSM 15970 TaxID=1122934 RepID=A0A1M6B6E1_9FIRM|nr:ERF family protein [Parasporobacterium paucivorans]SHI44250.1 ERF superfamily protein [Parasporobacterium paucivorans DSM 15970]
MENGKIYQAISSVMSEIGAIEKNKKNQQQGFFYRGVDDVMNALQPAMVKHKVFIVPEVLDETREERQTKSGGTMFYSRLKMAYKFFTDDGSNLSATVIGEAMDSGDKVTNKAMSIAFKYVCFQVFCIPTEEMLDPDAEAHAVAPKQAQKPQAKQKPEQKPVQKPEVEREALEIAMQPIDSNKIKVIESELTRIGIAPEAICNRYKVDSIAEITEGMFSTVMKALNNSKTKGE